MGKLAYQCGGNGEAYDWSWYVSYFLEWTNSSSKMVKEGHRWRKATDFWDTISMLKF